MPTGFVEGYPPVCARKAGFDMNFSRFFVDRPVFAGVLSVLILIGGLLGLRALPISEYPDVVPPSIVVRAQYPGANPTVIAETVATPIEEAINGVEDMLYMSSQGTTDGLMTLTVTFKLGTDPDKAQQLVQNRVSQAEPRLPEEVRRLGVTTVKSSPDLMMVVHLLSPNDRYDITYLRNYAVINVKDRLARIDGVGQVQVFGSGDYSMRVWLDPQKVAKRDLSASDVVQAIREQNIQAAAGVVGASPGVPGLDLQLSVNAQGRLQSVDDFGNIIVKTGANGEVTRLRDVARIELGAAEYALRSLLDNKSAVAIPVFQAPGSNAIEISDNVQKVMAELQQTMPDGVEYQIVYDTTQFVRASIEAVVDTLLEAIVLVVLVVILFLQTWRASIIPLVAVPISIIGTFAVMYVFGFSINALTLFGLVLAIGIVVDDAIVVVENTARHIEGGMAARPAAIRAMQEVTGPVIATTLVLLAVFVPTAFLPGITGQLYRQFGLTISAATVFSSINALTLSPALCALLLKPASTKRKNIFFRWFNAVFEWGEGVYGRVLAGMVRRAAICMVLFLGVTFLAGWGFVSLPTAFLPEEDQGYLVAGIQLPDAASQERTREAVQKIDAVLQRTPGVAEWVTLGSFSVLDGTVSSNASAFYIILDPFEKRAGPSLSQDAIIGQLRREFAQVQEGIAFVFVPPAIFGLGTAGGFQLELQDRGGLGLTTLQETTMEMARDGNAQAGLVGLNTTFRATVPQLFVDVDRTQAKTAGVPLGNVFSTMQAYLGSLYVNDFNRFGRTYQVKVQADHEFRIKPDDLKRLYARNVKGRMVPLGALIDVRESLGPQMVRRYNLYPSAAINGQAATGFSSGDALGLMEEMAGEKLPQAMGFEWTGMSFQEKQVGSEAILIFALAIVLVFLVLAAQYESWTAPVSIVLAVPFALLGVVIALKMRAFANDVYTQIGIVLLIGLASKTAILIVEFAREMRTGGKGITEAAVEASRLRFRPVLMTAISFVFGTLPLLIAQGAGAASRQAVGTAVFGGMLVATVLTVLFVPVFFRVFQGLGERLSKPAEAPTAGADSAAS